MCNQRSGFLFFCVLGLPLTCLAQSTDPIRAGYERFYQGDKEGADVHFQTLSRQRPDDLAAAYALLMALAERELPDEELDRELTQQADRLLKQAERRYEQNSSDADAVFYLASTYAARAGYRFNRREFWGAARDAAKAKRYSEEMVKLQPGRADAYFALGIYNYYVDIAPSFVKVLRIFLFLRGGSRRLGVEQLERTARDGELFGPQARASLAEIYGWLENRPRDALRLLEDLHGRYPDNPDYNLAIARLYASPGLEQYDRAAEEYSDVIERAQAGHPHYQGSAQYNALVGMARVRQQQWRLEEAVATLNPTIEARVEKPDWVLPRFLLNRGNYRALRNQAAAREDFQRVLAEKKWKDWHRSAKRQLRWMHERSRTGEAAVYTELIPGNRLVAEADWATAEQFYQRMQQRYPQDWQVRHRQAYLEFARGRWDPAAAGFQQIVSSNPGKMPNWLKANSLLYMARIHDLRGEREQAVRLYRKIVDDYEDEPAAGTARLGLVAPYRRNR
jgi:tetratricopeptide (TPR) repeat protein